MPFGLVSVGQWTQAPGFEHIPFLNKLADTLLETIRYLELNADSMPDYGTGSAGRSITPGRGRR
jgi:hypothetical protein